MAVTVYTSANPARLLLVDDHPMIRRGLSDLLSLENDVQVVGEANNGQEAINYLQNNNVDLIVLDNNMPIMNGIETLKRIRELDIEGKVFLKEATAATATATTIAWIRVWFITV